MSPANTRERILAGFSEQLLDDGYLGISLDRITSEIGIQRPSLYHHFPDGKEQIFAEVALRIIARDAERVAAAVATPGGLREKLIALALLHDDDPRRVAFDQRIFDATRHVSDTIRAEVSTRYVEDVLGPAETMMGDAVADGRLRPLDPGMLMNGFFGMAQAVAGIPEDVGMPAELRGGPSSTPRQRAEQVVEVFLHGAANDPG